MALEIKVPELGESISEVEIGDWLKVAGDQVRKDEPIATLESDKATVDLPAPESGTLAKLLKQRGQTAKVGEAIAVLEENGTHTHAPNQLTPKPEQTGKPQPGEPKKKEASKVTEAKLS